ncbi:hypothetical protein [Pleomorphovibrio marinus]|nr:hypothetical protein [Pleomorphovibrio marinus]
MPKEIPQRLSLKIAKEILRRGAFAFATAFSFFLKVFFLNVFAAMML